MAKVKETTDIYTMDVSDLDSFATRTEPNFQENFVQGVILPTMEDVLHVSIFKERSMIKNIMMIILQGNGQQTKSQTKHVF